MKIPSIDKNVKMQIWDTAGQEKYRTIAKNFYQKANGVIIVFSLDDPDSFDKIESWLNQIH